MANKTDAQQLFNVNGLVAVITGGGTGLGLYTARALGANGAKAVYILGRREEVLREAAHTGLNGSIKPIVADTTDKASLLQAAQNIEQEQGYINVLFANSGVAGPDQVGITQREDGSRLTVQEYQQAMLDLPMEHFTDVMHVNTTGVFYTAMTFLDLLDKGNQKQNVAHDSQIVITTSMAAFCRMPGLSFAYNVSKAATTHLAKMMSTMFAQQGFHIRVNMIAPGFFPCGTSAAHMGDMKKSDEVEGAFEMAACPTGRTGCENDLAGTVLFLASRAGAYLNGMTILSVSEAIDYMNHWRLQLI